MLDHRGHRRPGPSAGRASSSLEGASVGGLRPRRGAAARGRGDPAGGGRRRAGAAGRRLEARGHRGVRPTPRWRGGDASTASSTTPGAPRPGALESIDDATWEADFQLKLMAAVRLTRLALPQLRAAKGSVLFTLAMAAKAPGAGQRAELGHPGGRHGAHEGALQGVGSRRHPGQRRAHRAHRERAVGPRAPPPRASSRRSSTSASPRTPASRSAGSGAPQEFADLGCFLLSARASYVTGTADQPRWGAVAGRLRATRCSPRSPWRRRPRPAAARWRSRRSCRAGSGRRRAAARPRPTWPWRPVRADEHVLGHDEDDLVVLAHAARRQLAPQEGREEMHAGSVASTKGPMNSSELHGSTIVVTGVTGQVARPLALALARDNRVVGAARFSDAAARAELEAAGVECVPVDLVSGDVGGLPEDADYVLHFAVAKTNDWETGPGGQQRRPRLPDGAPPPRPRLPALLVHGRLQARRTPGLRRAGPAG